MTRNILYWHRHTVSVSQYCTIIAHVKISENHRFTPYLYQHQLFLQIIIAKLLALNVLSIALYTFKNFNNIYILQNYLSGHALKIKVYTQIIFEQETDSNII